MKARGILGRAGAGLLAGLVGGIAMTLVMLTLRAVLGISPPLEMIPDRFAPTLTIDQFFTLIGQYGGYNELKQFGVSAVLGGQLAVSVLVGLLYGLVARPGARKAAHWFLAAVVLVLWGVSLAVLWPTLPTSFIGLPPSAALPVTLIGLLVAYAAYGLVVALAFRQLVPEPGTEAASAQTGRTTSVMGAGRRTLLVAGIGAALAVASGALARRLWDVASFAYDGTRFWGPLTPITPNNLFYVVTKNVVDPAVELSVWRLEIGGHVDAPRSYSFAEISALAMTEQEATLMCISNGVGDALMSNAQWTGVPLKVLLDAAGPRAGGMEALLRGADGYTDTIPLEKALDPTTMVVFEMNGEPLPRIHGYPVRLIVPGMYGEKNVKWVTGIEIVTYDAKGFYEQQGWGPDFVIPIRSRFYEPDLSLPVKSGAAVGLRGIVYGGSQGISRAEVSTDDGRTWNQADLEYPGTKLSWAIWRFQWQPERVGEHRLAVRGYDANGTPQPSENVGIVPSGGRGYHWLTVQVVA